MLGVWSAEGRAAYQQQLTALQDDAPSPVCSSVTLLEQVYGRLVSGEKLILRGTLRDLMYSSHALPYLHCEE